MQLPVYFMSKQVNKPMKGTSVRYCDFSKNYKSTSDLMFLCGSENEHLNFLGMIPFENSQY